MNEEINSGLIQDVRDLEPRMATAGADSDGTDSAAPGQKRGDTDATDADADGTDGADTDGTDNGDSDGTDNGDSDGTDTKADADGTDH